MPSTSLYLTDKTLERLDEIVEEHPLLRSRSAMVAYLIDSHVTRVDHMGEMQNKLDELKDLILNMKLTGALVDDSDYLARAASILDEAWE